MDDSTAMLRALALARRGQGAAEPNPMVGCVVTRGGRVIGEGFHRKFGGPHAEVEALRDAGKRGESVRGSTVYVTLEPCCHHGKTPPCTDALIEAKPKRVVAAMVDPFPRVAGGGLAALRKAGIAVEVGLHGDLARELNGPFLKRVAQGLPWVIAKWAQSLDGRIADFAGQSKWISNESSRLDVHRLRARVDAVMIGIGTALADDPHLTARGVRVRRVARRVVVDPRLQLPDGAKLLLGLGAGGAPVTLAVGEAALAKAARRAEALKQRGVEIFALKPWKDDPARLDLRPLLAHLAEAHAATNVMAEGGSSLLGSLWKQRLIDEVWAYVTPRILGDGGLPIFRGQGSISIEQARDLTVREVKRFGDDVKIRSVVRRTKGA
ncbi:MAG: bifunctional diaminohydroxyphosphoribosylaminopyrimidine deaminase/5-amino-6-(5-phosphoribosylamino)uracil reductase RibD [Planctomycetota bacterium]|nr:bifunctional diaminohydroxyphosphoribosylaminopyrimidine deaminase/5-amino-6-(5-phosphoribosylamino)uracil reductase RibD [Planctomycetota bacterium]